jgi:hypothetical protein
MIEYSFREVRPAIDRGFNEVDEVDRPQPGGAACGALPDPRRRCGWRTTINRRPTLRRDRAAELNGLTKKFQGLSVVSLSPIRLNDSTV